VDTDLRPELGSSYKSSAQRARVVTEAWGEENLYCANCTSDSLRRAKAGTPVIDFICPACEAHFQLKSGARPFARRIPDAAYSKMRDAILHGRTPNLLALHYDPLRWQVVSLLLIPRFAFSLWAVEKRKALSPSARRKGWVGCDIALYRIPPDARISIITDQAPTSPLVVRSQFARLRPLEHRSPKSRGWTLDLLTVLRSLKKEEFSLAEMYDHATQLRLLHPRNRHVEAKIRQQLQRLRDMGFLDFVGRGRYRVKRQPGPIP
jgi:type II restriction enzyme